MNVTTYKYKLGAPVGKYPYQIHIIANIGYTQHMIRLLHNNPDAFRPMNFGVSSEGEFATEKRKIYNSMSSLFKRITA